ncbi:hypothetical protein QBZ16_004801 [Prototheca wickerhamii]|uniref:Uncharacterized protein n=1 Tax=Prototheca wickerhamii TaxID=3111 RepID=A0AAD9IJ72_PROWI|nr:hypothetical protein QBZ16_004801 [Prototheca wickerhamii]
MRPRAERDAAAAGSKRTAASLREALRLLQALNAERGAQEGREAALADARRAVAAAEEERDRARAALDRARTAAARSREQAGAAEQRALRAESALATLSEGLAAAQDASLREAGALREARGLVSQAEARREADRAVVEGLVAVVAETCAAFCGSGAGVCAAGDLAWGAPDTCSANNNPSPIDALARRASEMLETAAARAHTWRQAAQGAPALSALVAALRDELSHRIADVASLESQNTTLRADLEFLSEQLRSARSDLDGRGAEIDRLRALGGEKDATVAGACERLERLGAESAARRDGDGIDAAAVGSSQQGVDGDWRRLRERLENALTSVESARARDGPGDEVPLLRGLCRLALAVTMQHVSDGKNGKLSYGGDRVSTSSGCMPVSLFKRISATFPRAHPPPSTPGGTDGVSSATVAAELDAWMAGRRELLGSLGLLAAWDALRDLAAKQELRGRASEAPRGPATWQRVSA